MTTVTYEEYMNDKLAFIKKHSKKHDWTVYTSNFENNKYHKEYCFDNGAQFCEVNEMDVVEDVEIEAHGIKFTKEVHFIRHEYWSTEQGSKYWYEVRK